MNSTIEGVRFESTYTYGGGAHEMTYEVTASETPVRYAMRGDGPFPFPFTGVVDLSETPTGTRVTNTIDAAPDGPFTTVVFTLFRPVMRRVMAKRLGEELSEPNSALETPVATEATT